MTFWVTAFADLYARSLDGEDCTLEGLADRIRAAEVATKEAQLILKLAKFGALRSPAPANCLRHDANLIAVSGCEADYDGGEMPFAEAVARLDAAAVACIIHTTARHQPTAPRWRVWAPFSRELPPERRAVMIDRLNGVLGGVLGRESWTLSQAFYAGAVDGVPFEFALLDNEEMIDECDELDVGALPYQPPKPGPGGAAKPDLKDFTETELRETIENGQSYYKASIELLWRWAKAGVPRDQAEDNLRATFDAVAPHILSVPQQQKKWRKGRASIPRWAERTYARVAAAATKRLRGGGRPLVFKKPASWPDEVDGAALLDEITEVLLRHVVMPEAAAHAVSLWVLHSYVFTAAMITPRLLVKSPQKRSGKTTLLMLIGALAARPLLAANISPASVYRTVELAQPTLLLDEADTFLTDNEELRGVLNAGYQRGGGAIRTVGDDHEPRWFSCCCPLAVATIKKLPDTLEDRAVALALERRLKTEKIERLRAARLALLEPLVSRIQRWADDNFTVLETADPEIPAQLNDRAADCWHILLAIADCCAAEWPQRARKAAVALALDNADIETVLTQLLADIRDLFKERAADKLFSWQIVEALGKMEDRPWPEFGKAKKPITKVQLARLLAHFRISPGTVRKNTQTGKGYRTRQFKDAFERYLA